MTTLRKVWLLAHADGRCHLCVGVTYPPRWDDLVQSGECEVSEVPSVPFPDPPTPAVVPVKPAA